MNEALAGYVVVYFIGGVAGWFFMGLVVAGLVILFKRFRSRVRFIKASQYTVWGMFLLNAVVSYGLGIKGYSFDIANIGSLFFQALCASVLLLLIAYFDKLFLWLKKEII